MAFFSWIFLTAATAVAILVGSWLASAAPRRLNFDRSVYIGLAAGGILSILGALTSITALLGLAGMAIFGGIIGFVTTVALAWAIHQPWTSNVRNWLNYGQSSRKTNQQQNYWQNHHQPRYDGQYPPRPNNPPTNPTDPKKQHPWQ
ncbi:MAG: hypothetical protein L0H36_00655 [bacterium]|nr:hypothetical protein [bacterium]MDN5835128.1 hypothetical protein [bacterium]